MSLALPPLSPRGATKGGTTRDLPPAPHNSAVATPSKTRSTRSCLGSVAKTLEGLLSGLTGTQEFAHAVRDRASDEEWLEGLAIAVHQLGTLSDAHSNMALERQKAATEAAAHQSQSRAEALSVASAECNDMRIKIGALEAECAKLRDDIEFYALFDYARGSRSPRGASRGAKRRVGASMFASAVKRAVESGVPADSPRQRGGERMGASAMSARLAVPHAPEDPTARTERIVTNSAAVREHSKEYEARIEQLQALHAREMERMVKRMQEERLNYERAFETREQTIEERRRTDERRMRLAAAEWGEGLRRESTARAQASAASDVLAETQAEIRALLIENARLRAEAQSLAATHVPQPPPEEVDPPPTPEACDKGDCAPAPSLSPCASHAQRLAEGGLGAPAASCDIGASAASASMPLACRALKPARSSVGYLSPHPPARRSR